LFFITFYFFGYIKTQDPASSWLAYALAPGNGGKVTRVNATWKVMAYPTQMQGGNAPGWWFGIEPEPAMQLIQPILAYGYTGEQYSIFNGYYDWNSGNFWASNTDTVTPGQTVTASVWYVQSSDSYNMYIGCVETGWSVTSNIPANGLTFTDTYFVVEHQPDTCAEYPANGNCVFYDIYIEIAGKQITPQWQTVEYQDACNCQGQVVSSSSIEFTWQTSQKLKKFKSVKN